MRRLIYPLALCLSGVLVRGGHDYLVLMNIGIFCCYTVLEDILEVVERWRR